MPSSSGSPQTVRKTTGGEHEFKIYSLAQASTCSQAVVFHRA
jgi:hypothetical protein